MVQREIALYEGFICTQKADPHGSHIASALTLGEHSVLQPE